MNNLILGQKDIINDTKMNVIENPCNVIGNEKKWKKNCPKCGKEQDYTSKYTLQDAISRNKWCNQCRGKERKINVPIKGWIKNCSACGKTQMYSCKSSLTLAIKENRLCNQCRANTKKIIPDDGIWKRHCRKCGKEVRYSCRRSYNNCKRTNSTCIGCATKESAKYADKSYFKTNEYRNKMSVIVTKRWRNGNCYDEEFRRKCRENKLKQIHLQGTKYTYNPDACTYIDDLNKKFDWKLQHALNGGEVQIIGYSLDGYDKEKNIVFEYDEPKHHIDSIQRRDVKRQERLMSHLRPNGFFRYDEKNKRLMDVIKNKDVICQ